MRDGMVRRSNRAHGARYTCCSAGTTKVRTRTLYRPLNAARAKRRLAGWLLLCGVLLAVPIGILLAWTYQQLRNEAFYQYQAASTG